MGPRAGTRVGPLVAVAALMLSACGSGNGTSESSDARDDESTSAPVVVDGAIDVSALQSRLDAARALAPDAQEAELATADAALERELWTVSGLEEALGGPAAADAAFASHAEAIVDTAQALDDQTIVLASFRGDAAQPGPTIGEGLFGGFLVADLGADAIVSASNDFTDGQTANDKWGDTGTVSASREHAELAMDVTHDEKGVTTKLVVKVGVSPCPDASGHFEASAKVDVSATITGGSTGQRGTLDVAITGEVDDDANLASSDAEYQMQWADFAGGKGSFVDVSGSFGDTKVRAATLNRSGGAPNAALRESAAVTASLFAFMVKDRVTAAAQKGWQSGRCVILQPTAAPGPTGLSPGDTSTITAAPRSRVDGGPVGGSVTATLASGGASVRPDGSKVSADATFTYTAPDEVDQSATVQLEARSRRGVAKAAIGFDTKRGTYTASGGTEVTVAGTVADLTTPFTLQGTGQGFTVTYSYTPTSSTGGTLTYTGSGSGFTMEGSGTYAITGSDPDPLTLTQTAKGCVNIGGCRTTTNVITLTRTSG